MSTLKQLEFQDGQNLEALLNEDNETKAKRDKCETMVNTLKASLEFLNDVRDFYFEETSNV